MKIKIIRKSELEEDLFSNVPSNYDRKHPISNKKRRELEKRDKASRERSAEKRKKEDELWLGSKQLLRMLESLVEEELNERKKVPQCGVGNPVHDRHGRFSSKDTSGGSWSIRQASGTNCSHGQTKYDKGKRKFTKLKCGRKTPDDPNVKAKFKCKDGSRVVESEIENDNNDEWIRIKRSALDALLMEFENVLQTEPEILDEEGDTNSKVQHFCNAKGFHSIKQWLQHTNSIQRAEDGELNEPPKKSKS